MQKTEHTFTLEEILNTLEESRKQNLRTLKTEVAHGREEGLQMLHGMINEDKLLKMRFEKLYAQKTGIWR